jgi:hypothetical protein
LLSAQLVDNPTYRLSGDNALPQKATIVVHGGAVSVNLLTSRETTFDVDYIASYTDALLEATGLTGSIGVVSKEIADE